MFVLTVILETSSGEQHFSHDEMRGHQMSIFSRRVHNLRKGRGYTLQQLSKLIGISRTTLADYENESRKPSIETIQKLANVLDTTPDYLLGLTSNPTPQKITNDFTLLKNQTKQLHWDGVPLEEVDLEQIHKILERIVHFGISQKRKGEKQ